MDQFKRILLPLDASALSERAIDAAVAIAKENKAEIIALHVRKEAARLDGQGVDEDLDTLDGEAENLVNMVQGRHEGVELDLRPEVRTGRVVDTILHAAEVNMCDLIVMGSHGRKGLREQFTGSDAEKVVAGATVSVLVVKAEGFPYLRD